MLELGLAHSLLTPFTAFVAIDERIRFDGTPEVVEQPAVATPMAASGNVLLTSSAIAVHIGNAVALATSCVQQRQMNGRRYCLSGGVWKDLELDTDAPRLRVRRDSPAMRALLLLRPDFAPCPQPG